MCNSQAPLSQIDRLPFLHKNHLKVRTCTNSKLLRLSTETLGARYSSLTINRRLIFLFNPGQHLNIPAPLKVREAAVRLRERFAHQQTVQHRSTCGNLGSHQSSPPKTRKESPLAHPGSRDKAVLTPPGALSLPSVLSRYFKRVNPIPCVRQKFLALTLMLLAFVH